MKSFISLITVLLHLQWSPVCATCLKLNNPFSVDHIVAAIRGASRSMLLEQSKEPQPRQHCVCASKVLLKHLNTSQAAHAFCKWPCTVNLYRTASSGCSVSSATMCPSNRTIRSSHLEVQRKKYWKPRLCADRPTQTPRQIAAPHIQTSRFS